jgi:hypothetical protein
VKKIELKMKSFIKIVLLCFLVSGLSSCFKEKPIKVPAINSSGNLHVANMGSDYQNQVYFNMQTAAFVDSNNRYDYDLMFDCDPGKFNVWLNGAKLMMAARTGKYSLDLITASDTLYSNWYVEFGAGNADSNAIGKWWDAIPNSRGEVYVLNLGTDANGNGFGYRKMSVQNYTTFYNVAFANLDGTDAHEVTVPKNGNKNFAYLSFAGGGTVKQLEPNKDNWDLLFTVYSTYFYKDQLPYKVTGVLTNPARTQAYLMDSTSDFSAISLKDVNAAKFTTNRDGIGFEWKRYEFGDYLVNTQYNYIVKSDNRYFKLRFLSFSTQTASKGYPKIEYIELI